MAQGRAKRLTLGLIAVAMIGLAVACAEERGVEFTPRAFRLYVCCIGDKAIVQIFDTFNDSLVDTTDAVYGGSKVQVSDNGKNFVRFVQPNCPEIWDARSVTKIGHIVGCAPRPYFASRDGVILSTDRGRVDYISYPGWGLLGSDSLVTVDGGALIGTAVDESRGLLYCSQITGPDSARWGRVFAWDYRTRRLVSSWDLRPLLGENAIGFSYSIVPNTESLIAGTTRGGGARLLRIDLAQERVVWDVSSWNVQVTLRLTPDAKELWRGHRSTFGPSELSHIFIHEASSGAVVDSVALPLLPPPLVGYPLINDLVFTPDGHKAYAAAGDNVISAHYLQPVYIIDVKSRKIVGTLSEGVRAPGSLAIGPVP